MKHAIWGKAWLRDGNAVVAGDRPGNDDAAVIGDVGDVGEPECGAIPGHVGMVPGEEGELFAIRRETGGCEEVVPGGHDCSLILPVIQADPNDGIDRLALIPVILPNSVDGAAVGIDRKVSISELPIAFRCQSDRR